MCPLSLKEGSDSSICRYMCIFLAGSLYYPGSLKLMDSKYIFSLCKDYMWTSPCTVLIFFPNKHVFSFLYKWYYASHIILPFLQKLFIEIILCTLRKSFCLSLLSVYGGEITGPYHLYFSYCCCL